MERKVMQKKRPFLKHILTEQNEYLYNCIRLGKNKGGDGENCSRVCSI